MTTTITKRKKHDAALIERTKAYSLDEAVAILKKAAPVKFDSSVDIQVKLTADPTASDQVVRGTTPLPNGTGRKVRVVVITKDEAGKAAKEAGADEVGGEELIQRILKGWMDFDSVVASPSIMKDIAKLGRVLGPRGLMPSPKAGTVTEDLAGAVREIKKGRVEFKMDKQSNLHSSIGRLSFGVKALTENATAFVNSLVAVKPKSIKGDFIKSIYLSTTMGPGLKINHAPLVRQGEGNDE